MIKKGLKVGDKFEDGGRTFEVLEVYENGNYSSRIVEFTVITAEKPKTTRKKKAE